MWPTHAGTLVSMDRMQRRRSSYGREETAEILDLAGRLDSSSAERDVELTREDLYRIADELDIDPEAIDRAITARAKAMTKSAKDAKKSVRRRMRFFRHALAYVVTISVLFVIDVLGGDGWWFFYIAGIWGIVLALHAMRFVTRRNGPLERRLLEG